MFHVGGERLGQRGGVVRQAGTAGGGEGGVDLDEQRVDAGVLGFHRVEHRLGVVAAGEALP